MELFAKIVHDFQQLTIILPLIKYTCNISDNMSPMHHHIYIRFGDEYFSREIIVIIVSNQMAYLKILEITLIKNESSQICKKRCSEVCFSHEVSGILDSTTLDEKKSYSIESGSRSRLIKIGVLLKKINICLGQHSYHSCKVRYSGKNLPVSLGYWDVPLRYLLASFNQFNSAFQNLQRTSLRFLRILKNKVVHFYKSFQHDKDA